MAGPNSLRQPIIRDGRSSNLAQTTGNHGVAATKLWKNTAKMSVKE
jgi:hypothetical protein